MLEIIRKKWDKKDCPYHIVVPSLPGYTLSSSGPLDKDWRMEDSTRIMHKCMVELGFSKYLSQGGDVGSFTARLMAMEYDECVGVHCEFSPLVSKRVRWECEWC